MPSSDKSIRLKLSFESPPPGMPTSSKFAILVKPSLSKTVFDLEQLIIRKFGFAKGSTITLALDDFILVSTEEVGILNNDDHVSISVHCDGTQKSARKKKLESCTKNVSHHKSKKLKLQSKKNVAKVNGNCLKEQVERRKSSTGSASSDSTSISDKRKLEAFVSDCVKEKKIQPTMQKLSQTENSVQVKERFNGEKVKHIRECKTSVPLSPSKKEYLKESSFDNVKQSTTKSVSRAKLNSDTSVKTKSNTFLGSSKQNIKNIPAESSGHITFNSSSSSDSEMETETLGVTQNQPEGNLKKAQSEEKLFDWLQTAEPTISRNKNSKLKDPGFSTNVSIIIQNPSESNQSNEIPNVERSTRNYTEMLGSAWPPRIGDVIAYKLLEMSQDYTPVISDYKELKVLEIYPSSTSPIGVNAIKVEHLWPKKQNTRREGRFEMDLSDSDLNESVNDNVIEWQSLLDPKRIE